MKHKLFWEQITAYMFRVRQMKSGECLGLRSVRNGGSWFLSGAVLAIHEFDTYKN